MPKKTLYLGLNPPKDKPNIIHYPVIRIEPRTFQDPSIANMMDNWEAYTHLMITSRSAVSILHTYCEQLGYKKSKKIGIAVGKATASEMKKYGFTVDYLASKEQAEGVIDILEAIDLEQAYILWPHSVLSRSLLGEYLQSKHIRHEDVIVYDTLKQQPGHFPNFKEIDTIVFTSPSTVSAFLTIFGTFPEGPTLQSIGPITEKAINSLRYN